MKIFTPSSFARFKAKIDRSFKVYSVYEDLVRRIGNRAYQLTADQHQELMSTFDSDVLKVGTAQFVAAENSSGFFLHAVVTPYKAALI